LGGSPSSSAISATTSPVFLRPLACDRDLTALLDVRAAVPADLRELDRLYAEAHAAIAGRRGGDELAIDLLGGCSASDRLERTLQAGDALLIVACLDGAHVGAAGATIDNRDHGSRCGRLDLLYVTPTARRMGVATALFGEFRRWAALTRCTTVDAPALPGDRALKAFFEASGLRARLLVMSIPV